MESECHLRSVQRRGWSDAYLSSIARVPILDEGALRAVFDEIAAVLVERGVHFLQERIYGLCSHQDAILAARSRAFEARGLAVDVKPTFIEGAPCIGGLLAGAQIIGVVPETPAIRVGTVLHEGTPAGRELHLPGHRMLFFSGVTGFDPARERSVTDQADRMFANARSLVRSQGLSPTDIARTWIYMPRILDWYGEFNRRRTACFKDFGIIGGDSRGTLPASTGIQGRRTEGEECFMDLLAISSDGTDGPRATPMHNARQNEAYAYGSSFSRGMAVAVDDRPTLYLSGTASIDAHGRTVHHGDEQGQVMETLLDIASLLEGQNAGLRDIHQATAYCKGMSDYRAFERIVDHLDMRHIPFVPVLADVCRDELLFEIDSIAVTRSP